jgi:hypothetical protein
MLSVDVAAFRSDQYIVCVGGGGLGGGVFNERIGTFAGFRLVVPSFIAVMMCDFIEQPQVTIDVVINLRLCIRACIWPTQGTDVLAYDSKSVALISLQG